MAPAIRVAPDSTTFCAIGAFGIEVAEIIAGSLPGTSFVEPDQLRPAFAAGPSLVVLSLWRPAPNLCEQLDALAHEHGVPWLPIIAEHPVMRVGPFVQPGTGVCFSCYWARRVQNDAHATATTALHRTYDADPSCGPQGYLPQHARVVAGITLSVLSRTTAQEHTGEVVVYSPTHGLLASNPVVGCHGCRRCGAVPPPETHDRLHHVIRQVLA